MKFLLLTFLSLCLLAPSTDAAPRRKPARKGKRRAPIVRTCPPPVVRVVPDRVEVISQDEEDSLQSAIAAWMANQPEMGDAAQNKAREIAAYWARWRRQQGSATAETKLLPGEREMLLRGLSDAALRAELSHRFLTLFRLEELQAEAERRGLR